MPLYLDTETTGINASGGDAIVEIAIVDERGRPLIDTLVNPGRPIPWYASKVHGITDSMVARAPTLDELMPLIYETTLKKEVVIYNSTFDTAFFPGGLGQAKKVHCAMRKFKSLTGASRWSKLDVAAECAGYEWKGHAHRALADALACRAVWRWMARRSTIVF